MFILLQVHEVRKKERVKIEEIVGNGEHLIKDDEKVIFVIEAKLIEKTVKVVSILLTEKNVLKVY